MKRFIVLLTVLALVSPAFAATLTGNSTPATATIQNVNGGTVNTSTASWVTSPVPPGLTASSAPYAGAIVDIAPSTLWYKSDIVASNYGGVVNVDQSFGTGVATTYYSSDSSNQANSYDSTGKVLLKNGTMNIQATVWTDKFQGGTAARTATGGGYFGKSVMNIGSGGAFRVTGTSANSANSGNMVMTYGNNVDSFINMSGTGVLSGVSRSNGATGTVLGGRDLAFFKGNGNTASVSVLEISGSQATVEAGSFNMYCGNNSGVGVLRFIADSTGISTINVYNTGASAVYYGANTSLEFQIAAAPIAEGEMVTLINLVDDGGLQNFSRGKLKFKGNTINEGQGIYAMFGGQYYTYRLSYVGGTGNDVTLTYVPEPATMALLSLGGLLMARRRRA